MSILNFGLCFAAVPALLAAGYVAVLAVASLRARRLDVSPPHLKFTFLVPAHNEETMLERTLSSLGAVYWPPDLFRVHVVADNCTDATATVARRAGARVTVRTTEAERGKGHALAAGIEDCLEDDFPDAVVVIDADSVVDPNFLGAMQAHLVRGATVVQARYGVLGTDGWRPRLMSLGLALFHDVRSAGRHALGLSVGLRGNGMCFTREVLKHAPFRATSLVEDVEHGLALGMAGVVIRHASETRVLGEMPRDARAAGSQRIRWEMGRAELRRTWLPRVAREAWRRRSIVLADLAADLVMPTLTTLVTVACVAWLGAAAVFVLGGGIAAMITWTLVITLIAAYIARGVQLSERGWRSILDLCTAPAFMAWKVALMVRNRAAAPTAWVRTARTGENP